MSLGCNWYNDDLEMKQNLCKLKMKNQSGYYYYYYYY